MSITIQRYDTHKQTKQLQFERKYSVDAEWILWVVSNLALYSQYFDYKATNTKTHKHTQKIKTRFSLADKKYYVSFICKKNDDDNFNFVQVLIEFIFVLISVVSNKLIYYQYFRDF